MKFIETVPAVFAAPAPVEKYIAAAPAVFAAPTPVVDYSAPAPAIVYIAPAHAVLASPSWYVTPAPALHVVVAPVVQYSKPAGSSFGRIGFGLRACAAILSCLRRLWFSRGWLSSLPVSEDQWRSLYDLSEERGEFVRLDWEPQPPHPVFSDTRAVAAWNALSLPWKLLLVCV